MSYAQHDDSPMENMQELVAWDEDFFCSNTTFADADESGFTVINPASGTTGYEQPYLVSAPPSVFEDPPSLGYTVSGPPSIVDGQSSYGQAYCTSLSFDTTATSPLWDQDNDQYFGSFGACGSAPSPLGHITESPILDTRYERIADSLQSSTGSFETTTDTVFNPHLPGSSHAFSSLDLRASQAFANVGTWADQPQIVEPIAECDETRAEVAPIQIPRSQSNGNSHRPYPHSEGAYQQHDRTRAITIPGSARVASYNPNGPLPRREHRAPPMLSVSPVTQRRPRSATLSRSASQTRRKLTTPSPTESFGWVSYQPHPLTNKLAPTSTDGLQGRTPRGRKKGLTAEQRTNAALMRIIGACSNCQRRKEKCDPGTPCKSCLEHYKGDLVNHPCRDRLLSDLSDAFLSNRLGWHPTVRALESVIAAGTFHIATGITYTLPLTFGFGPALPVPVYALHVDDPDTLVHEHIIYSWPPESSSRSEHLHDVLPAVLALDATSNLMQLLESHISLLVTHHFRAFPLYCSPLRILRHVYVFSRSIPAKSPHSRILHQALKLLVLVHVGGDLTLPSRSKSTVLANLIGSAMNLPDELEPTPCFIRSQFGAVMPGLALSLMKDVLSSLEQLLLNRDCDDWPATLAILITVLMTVESIHYHAAKLPYHSKYDANRPCNPEEDLKVDDEGVKTLLAFYSACFLGCHARLRPDWEGEATGSAQYPRRHMSPEDTFVENVRDAIKKASSAGYLSMKASEKRQGDDMGFFFDRLVARLLLLKP